MDIEWENRFTLKVSTDNEGTVLISACKEGLRSLAGQLTALADEAVGCHIHYDEFNSLEEGSSRMIIEKKQ